MSCFNFKKDKCPMHKCVAAPHAKNLLHDNHKSFSSFQAPASSGYSDVQERKCQSSSNLDSSSNQKGVLHQRSEGDILSSPNLKAFTLAELVEATRDFNPDTEIGEGGFGFV
ncbi:Probable serine/threonine-protein kinase PBL3 [Linum grandiflorum]